MITFLDIIYLICIFFGIGIAMNVALEALKDKMGWRPDYVIKVYNKRIPKNRITKMIQKAWEEKRSTNPKDFLYVEVKDGDE